MTEPFAAGGRPAGAPLRQLAGRVDWSKPFARLSLTHALGGAGEALLAIALASSLFFKVDPSQGRRQVLLGLVLTMAPFAVVGPLIGPVIDRVKGGHRVVVVGSMVGRTVTAAVMVWAVATDSWVLFPAAFVMLVLGKTYQVARAALVPTVVDSDAGLVEANSKLQILAGIAGVVAAVPGGILFLIGPAAVMFGCGLAFAGAAAASIRLPSTRVAPSPAAPAEVLELRSAGVVLAASAMATIRGVVGFVTFMLAFELRGGSELGPAEALARNVANSLNFLPGQTVVPLEVPPKWYFGVVVSGAVLGGLAGSALAPRLRRFLSEERILLGAAALAGLAGLLAAVVGGLFGYASMSFLVSVSGSAGKQAFDSLVQRDAPDANRGRSFARFEARFQVVWVLGAVVPAALHLPFEAGAIAVAVVGTFAAACYGLGRFPQLRRRNQAGSASDRA